MKKKENNKRKVKLSFEKFQISKLNNSHRIKGGSQGGFGSDNTGEGDISESTP